ncbi:cadherin-like domain-containing protein, partial [Pseudomonas sp. BJa5]|uniref:cadherin-like domain-containing protein n=1 Tax=Pseudomonas sp. BJa5 TaxID=2936270 RepID=UPI002559687C
MATINGNDNANTLTGGTAADTLNGLGGDDILIGNAGDDTLNGGTGNDRLLGGRGSDTYLFGQGFGNDVIDNSGGASSDVDVLRLTNLNANQIRLTRIGNDLVLTVLATGETLTVSQCFLDADHAIDRIQFADGSRWGVTEALANLYYPPVTPTSGADVINGNPTDDTLQGLGGNDTLFGNGGNDTLDGGSGNDRMEGGVGNDTYVVDAAGDVVVEASNAGDDQVLASISYTLGNNVERLTLTGSANLNGTGNALANTLVGNAGNNLLDGGAGNDLIQGGDGNDTLQGGAGNDNLNGDAGNDLLDGGAGNDSMVGGSGDDTYVVDQSGDSVSEALDGGSDTVRTSLSYSLGANVENLELTGSSNLNGTGNALANRLTGNTANNVLDGGAGDDLLAGRRGSDTYRYGVNYGNDVIDNSGGASTDVDTVQLVGLNSNNVRFVHLGDDLQMVVLATSQTLTIKNFYLGVDYEIDRLRFDNNVVWNTATLKAAATLPANGAPSSTNDSQTTLEDTSVILGSADFGTYSDPENTPLAAVQITGLPALGSLQYHNGSAWVAVVQNQVISKSDLDAGKLQFVPALNGNGSGYASIGFKVGDGTAFAVNANTLSINVTPVNDAPTVSGPVSLPNGTEDTAYTLTAAQLLANASDVDAGTTLSVQSVSVDSSLGALTNNNNGTWTFVPANNLNGPVTFAVVVTDGSLQVATSAQLNLAPVNDAPVVTSELWTDAPENSFISTNVSTAVRDPDGDALTYTFAPQSSMGGSVSMFAGNPGAFFYSGNSPAIDSLAAGVQAVDVIAFTVDDGHGGSTNGTFEVRLTGTNDAPTVASALLAQNASEDSPFSYTVPLATFADVDAGDSLGYSASLANGDPLPGWLSFDAANRTFSGTPGNADVGSLSLKVTATDGSGAKVSSSFTLTIGNTNDAPTLQVPLFDQLSGLGQAVAYTVPANTFADVDVGDSLALSANLVNGDPLPAWLVFDAPSRTFSGTPPTGTQPGGIAITVTATDSGGLSVSDDFVLNLLSATVGTPNDDVLNGSVIDDAIYGLAGNDTLNGFGGNDLLDGGSG